MLTIERADVRDLRKRLRKAGIFDKDEAKQFRRFSAYSMATLGVLGLLIAAPAVWMQVALVPLIGLLLTPAVMHGHDGAHRSLSKNNSINKWMESLAFGLMGGMSTSWWRWKHNGPHHTHPNLISEDRSDPTSCSTLSPPRRLTTTARVQQFASSRSTFRSGLSGLLQAKCTFVCAVRVSCFWPRASSMRA